MELARNPPIDASQNDRQHERKRDSRYEVLPLGRPGEQHPDQQERHEECESLHELSSESNTGTRRDRLEQARDCGVKENLLEPREQDPREGAHDRQRDH